MRKKICLILLFFSLMMFTCLIASSNSLVYASGDSTSDFFVDSSLFTHTEEDTVYNQPVIDMTDFEKKLDNGKLEVYFNSSTAAIRVKNLDTGYIWTSDVPNLDPETTTNVVFKRETSAFRLLYRNADGAVKEAYAQDSVPSATVSGNTLKVRISLNRFNLKFTYTIELKDDSIEFLLKDEDIEESGDNKITSISLYSYFGHAYKDDIPGYIFLPLGSGALVRYSETSPITSTYVANFYGTDANITKNTESEVLSLPIYGVCHGANQNAMLVNIKNGEAFANLTYSPANIDQGFNYIYPTFYLREVYTMSIPGSDQITIIPEEFYKEDINIKYTFLSSNEANYMGMAKAYQKELVSDGILEKNTDTGSIDLNIEAFGRDYEKGLIFKKYHNMTTTKDIIDINKELGENGINDVFYTLRAFNKKGYSNQNVKNYKFDRRLGSMHDLKDLEAYFYYNPVESYNAKKSYPSKVLVNLFNEKHYLAVEANKYKFYANVSDVQKYTLKAVGKYDNNIALDGIGYRLYGDKNNKLTRSEVLDSYKELLGDRKIPMYKPNYYFLANTSKYLNMPLYSERTRFVTDSVPFLQVVLKGYIDYYSPYLNFSSNIDLDVLKCIEYGVNPSYLITKQPSYLLSNTLSSNFYATHYESVSEMIIEEYKEISAVLNQVKGSTITDRIIPLEGISVVTYSNGKKVIVNYTNNQYTYEGTLVDAKSYKVV